MGGPATAYSNGKFHPKRSLQNNELIFYVMTVNGLFTVIINYSGPGSFAQGTSSEIYQWTIRVTLQKSLGQT